MNGVRYAYFIAFYANRGSYSPHALIGKWGPCLQRAIFREEKGLLNLLGEPLLHTQRTFKILAECALHYIGRAISDADNSGGFVDRLKIVLPLTLPTRKPSSMSGTVTRPVSRELSFKLRGKKCRNLGNTIFKFIAKAFALLSLFA